MAKLLTLVAALVLAAPAALAAPPDGTGKPQKDKPAKASSAQSQATQNAAKQCKAERGTTAASREAFANKYGTNANKRNAFGKCVSAKAKEQKDAEDAEDAQEVQLFKNAAKECQAESADPNFASTHGGKTFEEFYGTNKNRRNAFGKCVSSKTSRYEDPLD
jgi:hypothetical protein